MLQVDDWSRKRRAAREAPVLQAEREHQLLVRAQSGDRRAVGELVASHQRLVISIAGRHARSYLSAHDLVAEGTVGLLEAIQRYDHTRDARFATYAVFWVRAFVSRFALANQRIVGASSSRAGRKVRARLHRLECELTTRLGRFPSRAELAHALGVHEDEVQQAVDQRGTDLQLDHTSWPEAADPSPGPDVLLAELELGTQRQESLAAALAVLTEKEQAVVRQQLCEEPSSLAEVARQLGVSRQRTGQIWARAHCKLRDTLTRVA